MIKIKNAIPAIMIAASVPIAASCEQKSEKSSVNYKNELKQDIFQKKGTSKKDKAIVVLSSIGLILSTAGLFYIGYKLEQK